MSCSRNFCRDIKRHSKGGDHIDNDFDILRIIKKLRKYKTAIRSVLDENQRKMCNKLSRKAIMAQDSTETSSDCAS